jgi:molecular chaperone GrpE (heat shock protein)
MERILIAEWMVSLSILAFFYWQSNRTSTADRVALEEHLNTELKTVKEQSNRTESALQSQLKDIKYQFQTSEVKIANLEREIVELNQQCQQLCEDLKTQAIQVKIDAIAGGFGQIQNLITQYPSIRKMLESRPDLPARNIIALLTSLENLVKFWECQPIGKPWEMVEYDPQFHQADVSNIQMGESVYVRFIGYKKGERILIPAKVSRTLPTGAKGVRRSDD